MRLVLIIFVLLMSACTSVRKEKSPNSNASNVIKKCFLQSSVSESKEDPLWFKDFKYNKSYLFRVRNKEKSGSSILAEKKNIIIAKLKLANLIASDFMSCEDQNQMIKFARSSNSKNQLSKIENSKLIDNIVSGFDVVNKEIFETDGVFTSYVIISKFKK